MKIDIKMLEKAVKLYAHMLRSPDTHLIPVVVGGVKVNNVYR
jgi:hypothetical protein